MWSKPIIFVYETFFSNKSKLLVSNIHVRVPLPRPQLSEAVRGHERRPRGAAA